MWLDHLLSRERINVKLITSRSLIEEADGVKNQLEISGD